jgi:hypothetical protein
MKGITPKHVGVDWQNKNEKYKIFMKTNFIFVVKDIHINGACIYYIYIKINVCQDNLA